MYEVSNDNLQNWDTMIEIINDKNLSGEDVLRYLTSWHGMSLLDKDFMENLIDCEL